MADHSLSQQLLELRRLYRIHIAAHQRPSIDSCRDILSKLGDLADLAVALELRAIEADQMEEVARDLDLAAAIAIGHDVQAPVRPAFDTRNVVAFAPRPREVVEDGA